MEIAAILVALAALAAVVVIALLNRGAGRGAELAGRLDQMAKSQEVTFDGMRARLETQEKVLGKMLEERLDLVASRVNQAIEKTAATQGTALGELRERIARIDAAQATIGELSKEVVSLNQILSNKQERGAFGELQLEELVRSVLPPDGYQIQATLPGGRRVDCLLKLPLPPGPIAIDAKFPLESYRALRAAVDEAQRAIAARGFRTDMQRHITDIAERYIVPGETAEAALLFLPSEAVYAELHANFAEVVSFSYTKRVFIVSPTTLWATLNTIRAVLKDVEMRELAGVVQKEVGLLLKDVERLDDRTEKLRKHFADMNEDVRQIGISTEKIVKRADSIGKLELETIEEGDAVAAVRGP